MTPRPFRRSSPIVFALLIAASARFPLLARQQAASHETKPASTYRVAGVVVSAATSAPLAQTRVFLVSSRNPSDSLSVVTQDDGRFSFNALPAGKFSLRGARRGYLSAAYEQHEQYSTAIVTGIPGLDTENLTLRLVPLAALSGTVLDETGEPVRNAQVRLFVQSHRSGTTRVVPLSGASTDDQGAFEFAPLQPANYFVAASATPWYAVHPFSEAGDAPPGVVDPSLDVAYPRTFFGGATDSDEAAPINVQAGDHAQVEIRLTPVPSVRLTLHVAQDPGRSSFVGMIFQRTFETLDAVPVTSFSPQSPGTMEIVGLPPGHYSYVLRGNRGERTQQGEIDLRQSGQDLEDSAGEPLGHVRLTMSFPKDEAPPKQLGVGLQDQTNTTVAYQRLSESGELTFNGLAPGKYTVRLFAAPKAYSVTQLVSHDAQISGAQFDLKPGESQEWTASVSAGNSIIQGFVTRAGKPASGIMVVLIPKDPESHQDLFRRDQSDLDGSFVLRGVIPGLYTVVAIEDAWGFDWSKPALLAGYAQHGQAVTIADPVQLQPR